MTRVFLLCVAIIFAMQGASGAYLFVYTDTAGNGLGFIEAAPQVAGSRSDFLFATGSISDIVFNGLAPSTCSVATGTVNAPDAGCIAVNTGPLPQHIPAFSTFDPGPFGSAGTFTSQFGGFATVKVTVLSGFLFLYQDRSGNIVVFSEPTPASSGSVSDFIFASGAISQIVFNGIPPSECGVSGAVIDAPDGGCVAVKTGPSTISAALSSYSPGAFGTTGTYSSEDGFATVQILDFTGVPEPLPVSTSAIGILAVALAIRFRRRKRAQQPLLICATRASFGPPN